MVARSANCDVQPNERIGDWEIVKAGSKRATASDETRAGAIKKARAMVRREGGGEIYVLDQIGKVVESTRVRGSLWPKRVRFGD